MFHLLFMSSVSRNMYETKSRSLLKVAWRRLRAAHVVVGRPLFCEGEERSRRTKPHQRPVTTHERSIETKQPGFEYMNALTSAVRSLDTSNRRRASLVNGLNNKLSRESRPTTSTLVPQHPEPAAGCHLITIHLIVIGR
ncbi:hypothetical protein GY45DRAFT_333741 [Cubamyces sp. BRFM 1775]|nr:hypothetical protein GY45DRAFT_333741 [Cubamyces sp. BRFM 1775]